MRINSLEHQELKSTENANKSYPFLFETLGSNSQYKKIQGKNPIQIFRTLEDLDLFLKRNQDILKLEDAGIAGYISYEEKMEIALYEKIIIETDSKESSDEKTEKLKAKVKKPDNKRYIQMVKKCQEYIKEGDIYQANIAHKFLIEDFQGEFQDIYRQLKKTNPAPYSGYMNFADYEIASSSPECFLKISKSLNSNQSWTISSSPIKGTAKLNELNKLIESTKEKAEHIMIVDLIRNDLGRICKAGSIKVSELMGIHKFKNLYHYISTIEGELQSQDLCFEELFKASFPGGSITGTPKIRAMQLIKEIEVIDRELFTGSMGYFKFSEGGEFNILIRSLIHNKMNGELSFFTGSGITAYSDPEKELEETYLKAEKIAQIFGEKLI